MAQNFKLKYLLIADDKGFTSGLKKANTNLKRHEGKIKAQGAAYTDLTRRQRLLDARAKEYALSLGTQSKRFKIAAKAARQYREDLKKVNQQIDKQIGLSNKGKLGTKGGLGGSILGVATKRILPLMAIAGAGKIVGGATRSLADFEEKISQVQAVTGENTEKMNELSEAAIRVSSVTPRTATEVANLQVELAKLGFTADENLVSMRSIIDLSVAGFTDLGETTTLVAKSLNAFNLSAGYTREVADTFAHAISTSALDLNKLAVGLPNVATAAQKFGWSLQKTTGLLGILADAGIDASKTGTDLRMIITQLTAEGLTLDQGLARINESTNKVSTAQKLFGQRAFVSALALADQADRAREMDEEFSSISGTAEDMAEIMQNNVKGAIKELKSAWERLVLSFASNNGIITKAIKSISNAINDLAILMGGLDQNRIDDIASSLRKMGEEAVNSWPKAEVGIENYLVYLRNELDKVQKDYDFAFAGVNMDDLNQQQKTTQRLLKEHMEAIKMVIAEYEGKLDIPVNLSMAGEGVAGDPSKADKIDKEASLNRINRIKAEGATVRDLRGEYRRLFEQQQMLQGIFQWETPEIDSHMNDIKTLIDGYEQLGATVDDFNLKVRETSDTITQQKIIIGEWSDEAIYAGVSAVSLAIDELATEIDRAAKAGEKFNWENFGQGMLNGLGHFLIKFGTGLVEASLMAIAAAALVSNPLTAPAGLVVGAAAITAGMLLLSGQKGGLQTGGGTGVSAAASTGLGAGYSQYAAADGARGISGLGGFRGEDPEVIFRIEGDDLVGVLNRQSSKKSNMF